MGTLPLVEKAGHFLKTAGVTDKRYMVRMAEIQQEIQETGTYTHTKAELEEGARLAWRNAGRCIGRLFWDTLTVVDRRHAATAEEVLEEAVEHLHEADQQGKIQPRITIFPPEQPDGTVPFRFLNHQLIRYAGWETAGDPASRKLTKEAEMLGWKKEPGPFVPLPLIVEEAGGRRIFRELNPGLDFHEVSLRHPEEPAFQELGLKWYRLPVISDMILEIGGIRYPAAPFNGWYMGTEIGARNFADSFRYDKLKACADVFSLNTKSTPSLWKDRALVELNRAVLYSFLEDGVSIVDHHTAAAQFDLFEKQERKAGRQVTGDWSWLIPPVSPAAVSIFHKQYEDLPASPAFLYPDSVQGCPVFSSF
ncbi:nitric oxide synthase oxygenase [Alkalicoccus urumqiensis]|uniref:Nitric oxide synthase oxygenase n=1 Tax=Alkalicoccus urumqiensis TaxID=1548213 RepID=A0A2P6MIR1_ALKUR|nr:nitric oxide synthase oxygenase [Alkalicoccus urumqiensis]PRO66138.1 nitric oxide synthase [Alkalicoccus urumqiensis]